MAYTRTNWVSGETPLSAANMNNIEDGIEELNSNKMFVPNYDTSEWYAYCFGYLTSNATVAHVFFPINNANKLTNVNVTKILSGIRTVSGGYIGGGLDANISQYITGTELLRAQGLIHVTLTKSGGWGFTNNTPLAGGVTIKTQYTVS